MKNWFELIDPDRDIKEGNFDPSVFAADLFEVWEGDAPSEYQDPFRFF
jgi:predicted AAA+ superfamily ATPase